MTFFDLLMINKLNEKKHNKNLLLSKAYSKNKCACVHHQMVIELNENLLTASQDRGEFPYTHAHPMDFCIRMLVCALNNTGFLI